ncbi:hypothetical protein Tco_1319983 [Tanacetum coccineum]
MFFYLITLNLARFLNETAPQVEPPKEGNGGLALRYHVMYLVIRVGLSLSMQLRMERLNLGNSPTANSREKEMLIHSGKESS